MLDLWLAKDTRSVERSISHSKGQVICPHAVFPKSHEAWYGAEPARVTSSDYPPRTLQQSVGRNRGKSCVIERTRPLTA